MERAGGEEAWGNVQGCLPHSCTLALHRNVARVPLDHPSYSAMTANAMMEKMSCKQNEASERVSMG